MQNMAKGNMSYSQKDPRVAKKFLHSREKGYLAICLRIISQTELETLEALTGQNDVVFV